MESLRLSGKVRKTISENQNKNQKTEGIAQMVQGCLPSARSQVQSKKINRYMNRK
jgi:hypothetical protein